MNAKQIALLASMAALFSGPALAEDPLIVVYTVNANTCGKVLALESMVTREAASPDGRVTIAGYEKVLWDRYEEATGYIEGFLTAVNLENYRHGGAGDISKSARVNTDVWPRVLSWCRTNPTSDIYAAVNNYVMTVGGADRP
jgi:hypothetical protein